MNNELGKKIAELRTQKGYSQKELSALLHVTQPTLCRWEKGTTPISLDTLKQISEILEVPTSTLISDNSENISRSNKKSKAINIIFAMPITLLLLIAMYHFIPKYHVIAKSDYYDNSYGNTITIYVKPTFFYSEISAIEYYNTLCDKYEKDENVDCVEIIFVKSKKNIDDSSNSYMDITLLLKSNPGT